MADLLSTSDLPDNFEYPREFIRVVELGLTNIEPWWIIEGDRLRRRYLGLKKRYHGRSLVPFAIRQDNDDVACWDAATGRVVIIHDFASSGFEQYAELPNFNAWLRLAIEDFIDFE
ncbi:MAG TPA: hypothetical protein VF444_11440 [Pseudonocardiaceae bacterium]